MLAAPWPERGPQVPCQSGRQKASAPAGEATGEKGGGCNKGLGRELPQEDVKKVVDEEEGQCVICFGRFTPRHPAIAMPCEARCNSAPVHAKCIHSWATAGRGDARPPEAAPPCPLCRGRLQVIDYEPPDPLCRESLAMFSCRKAFCTRPVPRGAGVVRCYIRVLRGRFELYLQAPCKDQYPLGPLPSREGSAPGDILLLVARRRGIRGSLAITLDTTGKDVSSLGANLVGRVVSSLSGLDHTVQAPFRTRAAPAAAAAAAAAAATAATAAAATANQCPQSPSPQEQQPQQQQQQQEQRGRRKRRRGEGVAWMELGCVRYMQNRVGRSVGPRRMQAVVPCVAPEAVATAASCSGKGDPEQALPQHEVLDLSDPECDLDEEEEEQRLRWSTGVYRPAKAADRMRSLLRQRGTPEPVAGQPLLLQGANKQPYWLDSIQAYSLDFSGRVTLPSNKNFQLLLEGSPTGARAAPRLRTPLQDVSLQFGKVSGGEEELYTMDLVWPLSPVQAFGICLSACVRKIACA